MKVSVLQENLDVAMAVTRPFVAQGGYLPICRTVKLTAGDGRLHFAATDLEKDIAFSINAMVEEEGAICIDHGTLREFVAKLPKDRVDLRFAGDEGSGPPSLAIDVVGNNAVIQGASGDDFPASQEVEDPATALIDPAELATAISRVALCAATDDSRPVLTGVLLEVGPDGYEMAAANGFRLAVQKGSLVEGPEDIVSAIVPARTLAAVARLLKGCDNPVRIELSPEDNRARFEIQGQARGPVQFNVATTTLGGTFPDYSQLIPERYETRVVLESSDLKKAVEPAAVFARNSSNILRLEMVSQETLTGEAGAGGQLKVSAQAEDLGRDHDQTPIEYMDGGDARIAFNTGYVEDVLKAMPKGQVSIEVNNASSPGVFRLADSDRYVQVVMPMYVQW